MLHSPSCSVQNPSCDMTARQPSATHQAVRWTHTVSPAWLTAVAPGAAVHNVVADIFDSLADGSDGIAEVIKTVTGGNHTFIMHDYL